MLFPMPINIGDIQPHPVKAGVGAHIPLETAGYGPQALHFRSPTLQGPSSCPGTTRSQPSPSGEEMSREGWKGSHTCAHGHMCVSWDRGVLPGSLRLGWGHVGKPPASKHGQMTQERGTRWGAGSCPACQGLGCLQPPSAAGSQRAPAAAQHPAARREARATAPHHTGLDPGLSVTPTSPPPQQHRGREKGMGDTEAQPWTVRPRALCPTSTNSTLVRCPQDTVPHTALSPTFPPRLSTHTPPRWQALPPLLLATLPPHRKVQDLLGQRGQGWIKDWSLPPIRVWGGLCTLTLRAGLGWATPHPGEGVPDPKGAGGGRRGVGNAGGGFKPPLAPWQSRPGRSGESPRSVVAEARHGEGTSKGLHTLAQAGQALLRLRILQQEGLELLELAWGQRGRR